MKNYDNEIQELAQKKVEKKSKMMPAFHTDLIFKVKFNTKIMSDAKNERIKMTK